MPYAELAVRIPDGIWIGDITRAHPDARVRVLAAFIKGDRGIGLAMLSDSDAEEIVAEIDTRDDVTVTNVIRTSGAEPLIQFETPVPLLLQAVRNSTIPLQMPIKIQNGRVDWEIVTSDDRLSNLRENLETLGISYQVEAVREDFDPRTVLTENQWQVVERAVAEGYYDTPRTCTLTELANMLDIAKSSCSETLHRA